MKEKIVCTVEVVEVGWLAGSCQCYDSYLIGGAISYALSHTHRHNVAVWQEKEKEKLINRQTVPLSQLSALFYR